MGVKHISRALVLAALVLLGAGQAHAQFLGYTAPQTTTSAPFGGTPSSPTSIACTGSAQVSGPNAIQNIGQSAHYVYLTSGDIASGFFFLQGSNDGVNFNTISDTASIGGFQARPTVNSFLVGTGYYNFVRVSVTCATGGHFAVQYSGTSVAPGIAVGAQQLTQYDKTILDGVNANNNFTSSFFQPPFGSAGGQIVINYVGTTPPSGSSINIICQTLTQAANITVFQGAPAAATGPQPFVVPPIPCQSMEVSYVAGGGGASVAAYIDYLFTLPGMQTSSNSYAHVTGTTATEVKNAPGTLHTLTINTGAAGTVSLFDLAPAACTGTPATRTVAVITSFANDPAKSLNFDAWFTQGICVKLSNPMDVTANFN